MNTFSDIVGNEPLKKSLQNAITEGKISHAYILEGAQGMGKKLLANAIAKTLQCEAGGKDACGNCISCRAFDSFNHPDVFYVSSKNGKSLGVEEIRTQVVRQVEIKQYRYPYKIFILEGADEMTVAAQNALLKTLEEPPSYAVFLLLAQNSGLFLPTIRSRCVQLILRPLPDQLVESYLIKQSVAQPSKASFYGAYAQGNIGQALEIASSEEFTQMREDLIQKLSELLKLDKMAVMVMAKDLEKYKDNLRFLDIIAIWYRDLLTAKKIGDERYLIQKDEEKRIFELAKGETLQGLIEKCQAVWQAKRQLGQNANFQLVMEILLMKLKES